MLPVIVTGNACCVSLMFLLIQLMTYGAALSCKSVYAGKIKYYEETLISENDKAPEQSICSFKDASKLGFTFACECR